MVQNRSLSYERTLTRGDVSMPIELISGVAFTQIGLVDSTNAGGEARSRLVGLGVHLATMECPLAR